MQLFRLSTDAKDSVAAYPDKYTYNQIRECDLICRTALHLNGCRHLSHTHEHHPIVQWTAESLSNYQTVVEYAEACNSEWVARYNHNDRIHGSLENIRNLPDPTDYLPSIGPTLQPCAFPDKYKLHTPATSVDEVIANYRNYIIQCKSKKDWFKYERADPPEWLTQKRP